MARQGRSNASTDTVESTTTEVTETPTETPAAPAAEVPINLDAFKAVVETSLGEADGTTGQVPEAAVAAVNEEYRKLDGQKAKNAGRTFLEEQMLAAVGELDATKARSYSELRAGLSAGGGSSAPKAPADPTAAFVQRVASLRLALSVVEAYVGENVKKDWSAQADTLVTESGDAVTSYQTWANTEAPEGEEKPEAPEVSPVVRQAIKLSTGKASGGRTGGGNSSGLRRDTAKHIASAFAGVEVGTFLTIAEIAKHKSEEYGDDSPSQGAISARLFPTTTVAGVEPIDKGAIDGKNPKGARKVA